MSPRNLFENLVHDYQGIILLLDAEVVALPDFYKLADHVTHQARFEYRPVFTILLEPCSWDKSSLRHLPVYPLDKRAISEWPSEEEAWYQVCDEIWHVLKPYTSFFPESDRAQVLRSIGKVAVGRNQSFVSGFLIAPDVLLTSNLQINSSERAAQATVSFTDAGGLTASFTLLPSRFFLTDPTMGVSLVGVSPTPERSDYRKVRTIEDYHTLKLVAEPVKPGDRLDAANFDRAQQLRPNAQTVDVADGEHIQYWGTTLSGTAGGPLLNENLEVVAVNSSEHERWSDYELLTDSRQTKTTAQSSATVLTLTALFQAISDRFSKGGWVNDGGIFVQDILDQAGNSLKFNHLFSQPVRVYIDLINSNSKDELSRMLSNDQEIIQLQTDEKKAEYVVRERSGQFYITYPVLATDTKNIFRPLVAPIKSSNQDAVPILVSDLQHIARWEYLRKFSNPSKINNLPKEPLSIKLWNTQATRSEDDISPDGLVFVEGTSVPLHFQYQEGEWGCPLRVELTNITEHRLYVSVLYLSMGFESYPSLLPDDVYALEPGKSIQLMYEGNPVIPFQMSEIIPLYNWPERTEYFKFMSSTEPYDIRIMQTDSLPEPVALSDRGGGRDAKLTRGVGMVSRKKISITNWATQFVALRWLNPLYDKTPDATIQTMYTDPELNFFATGLYPNVTITTPKIDPISVWQPNGNTILVVGTGNYNLTDIEINVSEAIGLMLATEQYSLLGGGWPGVDHLVGRAYSNKLTEIGVSEKDYFTQIVVADQQPDYKGGSTTKVGSDSEWYNTAISQADAVIMIGGLGGTYTTYKRARNMHIPVISLATTGGDAKRAYYKQKKSFMVMYSKNQELCDLFAKLDDPALGGTQIAEIVGSMLKNLLFEIQTPESTSKRKKK